MSQRRLPIVNLPRAAYDALADSRRFVIGNSPQRPAGGGAGMAELNSALGELARGFTGFVEGHTAQMQDIRAEIDGLQEAAEENSRQLAALRVGGGGAGGSTAFGADDMPWTASRQRRAFSAFGQWLRNDCPVFGQGGFSPMAAVQTDSLPDGGGTVGEEVEGVINKLVKDRSPIRALARIVRLTRGNRYLRHYWTSEAQTGGWVGEADPRNETTGPVLAELDYPVFEQFAQPFASNILLQDSDIDIGAELGIQVSDTFAIQEGVAFLRGSGVRQPRGILSYPTAATGDLAGRPFGTIEIRTIDFAAAVTAAANPIYDGLIDAWYSMRAEHRQQAVWMCSSTTLSRLRQTKDLQGNYIWQRSNVAGQPDTLLGAPVFTNEDCDAIASGKTPIILADWQRAYTLVDKAGIIILKDPYTTKGFTKFYSTKRVGGGLDNSNAVKLIKAQ